MPHGLGGARLMANDERNVQISADSSVTPAVPAAPGRIDPAALTVAQAAKVLSAVGNGPVTEDMLRRHIAAGAPTTADGRINLIQYAAWLNMDNRHGD